ncbi:MAG: ABC transporter ATP-binding protein [Ignavibacteria bacterium]|nr:ABC transporter ATP-binding protein [Ignavibacteria bacterium]
MNTALKIQNLSKNYNDVKALIEISFQVFQGEMFGLVGPDGAGKTTMIRILTGLVQPTSGAVSIFDFDITKHKKQVQKQIGYLSQKFSLYGDLSVDENIEFFANIHGVKNYHHRRDELLNFTRLSPFRNRLAERLSGGMKQKLALACSLIHKPRILFLDEPTTGVDPVSRRDFWKILSNLLKEGITIFMSTPYLDEAERCNRVALLHKGKIMALDTPRNINSSIRKRVIELICEDIKKSANVLKSQTQYDVQLFGDRLNVIVENPEKEIENIKSVLQANSIKILEYRFTSLSLENVFIHLIEENY